MDNMFLICMDGGGSKTEFCIKDIKNDKTYSFVYGSSNYKAIGFKKASQNIIDSFNDACNKLNILNHQIKSIVFGISGCDTQKDLAIYQSIINTLDIAKEKVHIFNDSVLSFLASAEAPGICAVCGTGSIAIGFNKDNSMIRCGGWGSPLSDEGSGYWIGFQVLKNMVRYLDGNGKPQNVYNKVLEFLDLKKSDELPSILSSFSITKVASVACVVCEEADKGDIFCLEIVKRAAKHIAGICATVYTKMNFSAALNISLVMTGSIFKNSTFNKEFCNHVITLCECNNINFIYTNDTPAKNGIRLAEKLSSSC